MGDQPCVGTHLNTVFDFDPIVVRHTSAAAVGPSIWNFWSSTFSVPMEMRYIYGQKAVSIVARSNNELMPLELSQVGGNTLCIAGGGPHYYGIANNKSTKYGAF